LESFYILEFEITSFKGEFDIYKCFFISYFLEQISWNFISIERKLEPMLKLEPRRIAAIDIAIASKDTPTPGHIFIVVQHIITTEQSTTAISKPTTATISKQLVSVVTFPS
jgi:hypothetical protein